MTRPRLDLPGMVFGLAALVAWSAGPFVVEKANRIVPGVTLPLKAVWHSGSVHSVFIAYGVLLAVASLVRRPVVRFTAAATALSCLCWALGTVATELTPPDDRVLRIAPGLGF